MSRRRVEIEVTLLDVLAVITLVPRQTEKAFFQNRVAFVPESHREANQLMAIADTSQSIFVPPINAGPGVVMRKEFPGGAMSTVVFAHRSPRAFAEVGSPAFPVFSPARGLD